MGRERKGMLDQSERKPKIHKSTKVRNFGGVACILLMKNSQQYFYPLKLLKHQM